MKKHWLKIAVAACAASANAQALPPTSSPKPAASLGIEEVMVTARRKTESIQSTPVAVTALSSEALQVKQVQSIADLSRTTPNLNISTGGGGPASLVFLSIRGQTQGQPSTSADPAVATYIDGVYYARPTGGDLDMFDVNQAEILRGPQGTLFGRNTTGGAINIQTNDPTETFEGLVKVGAGNLGKRQLESMINVPIKDDQLTARFVYRYLEDDGYSKFARLNNLNAGDVDSNHAGRVKLLWAPAEQAFSVLLAADYSEFRSNGQATTTLAMNPDLDLGGGFTTGMAMGLVGFDPTPFLTTSANFRQNFGYADTGFGLDKPHEINNTKGASLTLNTELGNIDIKSITSFRKNFTDNTLDLDGLPINLVSFRSHYDQRQFSQELQLSGSFDKLDWIAGAMYFRENSKEFAESRSFSFLNPAAPLGRGTSGDTANTSTGIFGQINYNLTDKLRATLGYRHTRDTREIVRHSLVNVTTGECAIPAASRDVPGGACDQTQSVDFSYPSWVLSIDYQLNADTMLYAKTSGASMAGGWNLRGNFAPAFSPEKVRDVEAGIKADMLDSRLRTNLALFHTWQDNAQRVVAGFDPQFNSSTQYVINAGDARLKGIELEATLIPWQGMTINATYAYLDSEYASGSFTEEQVFASSGAIPTGCGSAGAGRVVCSVDRSDEALPFAPEYNWTLAFTQEIETRLGLLSLHADYAYTAAKRSYSTTAASQQSQSYRDQVAEANRLGIIDGYGLLSALIRLNVTDQWQASIWGRNLTDKDYIQNVADYYISFGPALGVTAPPRTYGASISYNW